MKLETTVEALPQVHQSLEIILTQQRFNSAQTSQDY